MTRWLTLAALVGSACVEFDDVPRDVCGNGVVEQGGAVEGGAVEGGEIDPGLLGSYEECDGSDGCGAPGSANACRWTCADGASCPDGMVCGLDDRCRTPAGTMRTLGVLPMQTDVLRIADLDGDDLDDLAVGDVGHAEILYGDATAPFEAGTSVALPQDSSAVGLLQANYLTDSGQHAQHLLIGAKGNVTLYAGGLARNYEGTSQITADYGEALLDALGTCPLIDLGEVRGVPDENGNQPPLGVLVADGWFLGLTDVDGDCDDVTPDEDECLLSASGSTVANIGIVTGRATSLPTSDYIVAPIVGETTLKVFDVNGSGRAALPRLRHTLALPADQFVGSDALVAFGDTAFDADACPDIVVVTEPFGFQRPRMSVTFGQAVGDVCVGFGAGDPRTPIAPDIDDVFLPLADEFGFLNFVILAVEDVDGDGDLEVIGRSDVGDMLLLNDGITYVGQIDASASMATSLDHNRDGLTDFAVISTSTSVEVLINTGDGGYSRRVVDVGAFPSAIRKADLDGDRAEDFVLRLPRQSSDVLMIGWGDPGGQPTTTTPVAEFPTPSAFRVVARPGLDEIMAYSNPEMEGDTCSRAVSQLRGDASRHLSSPVTLLAEGGGEIVPLRIVDVSDDAVSRAIVFGQHMGAGVRRLVAARVDEDGGAVTAHPVDDTKPAIIGSLGTFELSSAVAAGAVLGDGRPDAVSYATNCCETPGPACSGDGACLIAADGATYDPVAMTSPLAMTISMVPVETPAWDSVRLTLRDIDLDGDDDALMAYFDSGDGSDGGYALWIGENQDGTFTTIANSPIPLPSGCTDVAIGPSTAVAGQFEVVAGCFETVGDFDYQAFLATGTLDVAAGEVRDVERWEGTSGSPYRPYMGDFNGDRIDDLALVIYDTTLQSVAAHLYLGCALNDENSLGCAAPMPL